MELIQCWYHQHRHYYQYYPGATYTVAIIGINTTSTTSTYYKCHYKWYYSLCVDQIT